MDTPERRAEFPRQVGKRRRKRRPPRDHHIIVAGAQSAAGRRGRQSHHFPQSASDAVALHGVAHLFRYGKTHPRGTVIGAPARLHQESIAGRPHPGCGGPKLAPASQPLHGDDFAKACAVIRRSAACGHARGARPRPCGRPRSPSGRETRGGACAPVCSADRSVSRPFLRCAPAVLPLPLGCSRLIQCGCRDCMPNLASQGRFNGFRATGARLGRLIREAFRLVNATRVRLSCGLGADLNGVDLCAFRSPRSKRMLLCGAAFPGIESPHSRLCST